MSNIEHDLYGGWKDDDPINTIDRWLESDTWMQIVTDADNGDEDSIECMDQLNDMLGSLTFHISNDSGIDRIGYEFKQILNFINMFN